MKIVKSYRFRIYPTKAQEEAFRRISGCCRLVYNLGLEQRRYHWRRYRAVTGNSISWFSQNRELVPLKKEFPFLAEVPSHCLQEALRDLDLAFQKFFREGAGYPRYRRKRDGDSFRFPDPAQFSMSRCWLYAPKFGKTKGDNGRIRIVRHRKVKGRIKTLTIIREGVHWYAVFSAILEVADRQPKTKDLDVVGIDRGVTVPVALSDGRVFGRETEGVAQLRRLKRLQQSLARKRKGSENRARAIRRLSAFKARQARRRKDLLHKISSEIVKSHDVIVLEDLEITNMIRSARGTMDAPGRRVAQKAGLNRSILDRGWGMFGNMLVCKAGWAGKRVIKVSAQNSSRTCIVCGHVAAENRVRRNLFCCVACGHTEHADTHAAREIRRRGIEVLNAEGLSVSACGELCTSISSKQEETREYPGKDQISAQVPQRAV